MRHKKKRRGSRRPGVSPGSLIYVGEERLDPTGIDVIRYDAETISEHPGVTAREAAGLRAVSSVTWINVRGVHDASVMEELGQAFGLHPLLLEDVVHTDQRPKLEAYDDHLFLVTKMIRLSDSSQDIEVEQLSLVLGDGYVISFQETSGDVFDPVRHRVRNSRVRIRSLGADYLLYALVDAVVDHYFLVLDRLADRSERLEADVFAGPAGRSLEEIQRLKHDLIFLRRSVWPLREALSTLLREGASLVDGRNLVFFRDVYDHTIHVLDTVEALRDTTSGLLDIYLSAASNRLNEVMKLLTIIATIFIPLTFIAGVYGMNFEHMPELHWPWAYPAVLGGMALVALGMLAFFRRRGWL
jgi:magnesium transporter